MWGTLQTPPLIQLLWESYDVVMRIKKEQSRKKIITDLVHEVGRRLKFSKVIMIAQSSAFIIL